MIYHPSHHLTVVPLFLTITISLCYSLSLSLSPYISLTNYLAFSHSYFLFLSFSFSLTISLSLFFRYFKSLHRRTVFSAHGWFLNFDHTSLSSLIKPPIQPSFRPLYIGTMRDPLKRLISHYSYLHQGPRSTSSMERHQFNEDDDIPDFPTCVSIYMDSEVDKWKCMHWANIQLKYFCG